ncbi:hypothetical protein AB4Z01_19465 [Inquilinus sp. YAF38]|uniref:Mu transposase domain-containing protein n=1 Tax=Inquilinus sp. YAF38 TaxID=3233084 RepID=UPI003F928BF7
MKRNAIAGHSFASCAALQTHLVWWMREIADWRVHRTTGEPPLHRFRREEATALRPIDGRPPLRQVRDLSRRVQSDCFVEVDTNVYSVPYRPIGKTVRAVIAGGRIGIRLGGQEVAAHLECAGRRQRLIESAHFSGTSPVSALLRSAARRDAPRPAALLRTSLDIRRSPGRQSR